MGLALLISMKIRQANKHLFGIVTRYHHQHGRRVHKPALRDEVTRSRWYGNYGIFRYATRMSATYERGGQSEFGHFADIKNNANMTDPLITACWWRHAKKRKATA